MHATAASLRTSSTRFRTPRTRPTVAFFGVSNFLELLEVRRRDNAMATQQSAKKVVPDALACVAAAGAESRAATRPCWPFTPAFITKAGP